MFRRALGLLGVGIWIGVLVVAGSGFTSARAALDVDPCALMTADEVTTIIGPITMGPVAEKNPAGQVLDCGFVSGAGGLLMISVSDAEHWDMRKGFIRPDDHAVNLPGLGQEAIYISPDDGANTLAVLTPPYVLEIRSTIDNGEDQQMVVAAAQKALPRLK